MTLNHKHDLSNALQIVPHIAEFRITPLQL